MVVLLYEFRAIAFMAMKKFLLTVKLPTGFAFVWHADEY